MNNQIGDKIHSLGGVIPIGDQFVPVNEDELIALESTLGVTLPRDYRDFLKAYGACMFDEYVDFQPIQNLPVPISDDGKGHFASFYGAKDDPFQPLVEQIKTFQGRMPETMIPIGDDGGGDQICLGIKGDDRGKVYYWDHRNEWDEQEYMDEHSTPMPPEVKFQNVYLIAESFEDFIQRLEPSEDV